MYDLIVIGSGSGQDVAVAAANQLNWKVAIIEKGALGGTCLNRGCIPSKMLIYTADIAETIRQASKFGIEAKITKINFPAITQYTLTHVTQSSERIKEGTHQNERIDLYQGKGSFVAYDPQTRLTTLKVRSHTGDTRQILGKKVLIAAGARPSIPPIPGIDEVEFWTSTEALRAKKQPQSLAIIGGGYISAELGHFYGALGTQVTIIQRGNRLLTREDTDISREFTRVFSQKYTVFLNTTVEQVREETNGIKVICIKDYHNRPREIKAEALLLATGTVPNTDSLEVEKIGIKTNDQGYIMVDEFMQSSVPGIYALGDITGIAPFKHAANYQAKIVFYNLAAGENRYKANNRIIPRAVFSSPQIAAVGLTQQEAEKQNLEFKISRLKFSQTAMGGAAMRDEDGFVKFILSKDGQKILGCHIMGPWASILIQEVVVAMSAADGAVKAIKDSIHIHPALSEVVARAL